MPDRFVIDSWFVLPVSQLWFQKRYNRNFSANHDLGFCIDEQNSLYIALGYIAYRQSSSLWLTFLIIRTYDLTRLLNFLVVTGCKSRWWLWLDDLDHLLRYSNLEGYHFNADQTHPFNYVTTTFLRFWNAPWLRPYSNLKKIIATHCLTV